MKNAFDRPFDAAAVPIEAFTDRTFPALWFSAYGERRYPWGEIVGEGIAS